MGETAGVLIVNKPRGITSHDVVANIRRLLGGNIRVGHAGTLDPLADGVLVILIGSATKRQHEFLSSEKEYAATIRLGATSTTDDAEGELTPTPDAAMPDRTALEAALEKFRGEIEQTPPVYSAVKLKGKKAYEIARKGGTPVLAPRRVTIRELEIIRYNPPDLELRAIVSAGTYIRAIARDLGRALGIGGYLAALTRTRSGRFALDGAIDPATLTADTILRSIKPL